MIPETPVVHLVDDDASFLKAIARLLAAHGFQVRTFNSATDLLAQIGAAARGCVVADLHMPSLSGLELHEALIRLGVTLPVIILTGQADMAWSSRVRQQGAQQVLEKLAPKEELLDAVMQALERDAAATCARRQAPRPDSAPE